MKNLFLKSLVIYIAIMATSVVIQGCCEEEYRITGNGTFEVFDKDFNPIDTLKNEFVLIAAFEIMRVGMQVDAGLINSALATSCGENYLNGLLANTVSLSLDKSFKYNGQTIEAGSNFINLDPSKFLAQINSEHGFVEIRVTTDFLNNAEFDKGYGTFHVNGETTDGLLLENDLSVYLDL